MVLEVMDLLTGLYTGAAIQLAPNYRQTARNPAARAKSVAARCWVERYAMGD